MSFPKPDRSPGQHRGITAGVGISLVLALLYMFWNKLLYENFTGDGSEAYYFSLTALENGLPHWDLETGQFGFALNFFLFSYPGAALIYLLGPIEAAVRIPLLLYVLLVYWSSVSLSTPVGQPEGTRRHVLRCSVIALVLFYTSMLFGFYSTHHPYTADLAEPTGTDLLLSALLLFAFHALWMKRYKLFLGGLLAMAMAQQGGVPWAVIVCASATLFLEDRRRQVALSFLAFAVCWVAASWLHQRYFLEGVENVFSAGTLFDRALFNLSNSSAERWWFLAKYYLLTGGVLVVPCLAELRRIDPFTRTLTVASLLFGLATILFGSHIHYFATTAYLAPVIFARWAFGAAPVRPPGLLGALPVFAVVVLLLSVWPDSVPLYRAESALGRRTLFDYDSRREAIAGSNYVIGRLWGSHSARAFPDRYWGPGNWGWVYYSKKSWESGDGREGEREVLDDVDYIVSNRGRLIPGFDLLIHDEAHHFYARSVEVLAGDIKRNTPTLVYPAIIEDALVRDFEAEDRLRKMLDMYTTTREQLDQLPATPARWKLSVFLKRESARLRRRLTILVRLGEEAASRIPFE